MSNILNNILIVITIVIIIICFIVGFKIKEGITCDTSQVSVLDMKLSDYNCLSLSNSNIPKCINDQQLIINAPNNEYRCATVYGNPVKNTCSINTNNLNDYIITCDGYSSETPATITDPVTSTPPMTTIMDPVTPTQTTVVVKPKTKIVVKPKTKIVVKPKTKIVVKPPPNIYKDYSPFVYPTFTEPTYNLVSKLIIKPASSDTQTTSSSSNSSTFNNSTTDNSNSLLPHSDVPTTRMTEGNNTTSGIKKPYVFESIPFPYLPPFKSF